MADLPSVLEILSLLSTWIVIESVVLTYKSSDGIHDPVKEIREAKKQLIKKAGFIEELSITESEPSTNEDE